MMNGSISVDSEKGVGTTFTVNLPLKNSNHSKIEAGEIDPESLRVLVIDDDSVSCSHAQTVLSEAGISSESCESGTKALDMIKLHLARREKYNLMLIDWQMPNPNGIETAKQIRKIVDDDTPVIILTAYDIFEVEAEAKDAGIDGFMTKPLSASNLMYELQQIYSRRSKSEVEIPLVELEGRRVLVAEDMMVNAQILMMLLDMRSIQADHAVNGKIVVEMFEKSPPNYYDAILMDIRMPEMDGLEATAAIRALDHPDAKTIPIIAMTANAFDEDVQRSLQAGMNAHLSKPVEPEHMYQTLQELIGKKLMQNQNSEGN